MPRRVICGDWRAVSCLPASVEMLTWWTRSSIRSAMVLVLLQNWKPAEVLPSWHGYQPTGAGVGGIGPFRVPEITPD